MRAVSCFALAIVSLLFGCKSKPAPPADPPPDHAKACREGNQDSCAQVCLELDGSTCKDVIDNRRSEAWKDEKLFWKLLERACKSGDADACEELGGLVLGRDKQRALDAYERACAGRDGGGGDCVAKRKQWISDADVARPKCEAGDSGACVDLGEVYWAAQSADNTVEAFAKACELRGFDNDDVFPDVSREICRTGETFYPQYPHPGARGRCGNDVLFEVAQGHARSHFNEKPYGGMTPPIDTNTKSADKHPRKPIKLQIGTPSHYKGDYPAEKLLAIFEQMKDRFGVCVSESPELKGGYSFHAGFALDRVGVPAFVRLHRKTEDVAHLSGEPWYRLSACFQMVVKTRAYPAPPAGKGMRIAVPFTVRGMP